MLISCNTKEEKSTNPLLNSFDTPFGVPPFESIKLEHYQPAFEAGMAAQVKEIETIANNPEAATFENTIVALEYSGALLQKVNTIFGNLMSSNTSDSMQALAKVVYPQLSKHQDEITMNDKLFQRVKAVKEQKINRSPEDQKLLDETYKSFARNGANLNAEQKERMKAINEQLSLLSLQFGDNLLAEINDFKLVIDKPEDLAGLPEDVISAAKEAAGEEGKWVFTLHKPSWIPFLQYSEKRELREKLYKAMYNCGNNNNEHDNKEIIKKTIALRTERANLLGYKTHADYTLDETMAKTPEKVYDLLNKLWEPALKMAKQESATIQSMINKEGGKFKVESWDWWYYTEKIRKEKYDLDESEMRPYFELNNVRDGAFLLAQKLWGLTFTEVKNIPLPHPEAKAFEVKEAKGKHVGLLYVDYFPRESKRGGAWMSSFRDQYVATDGQQIAPIITNTCNFSKPTGDKPALLSFDEVTTLFHEFGHALHGLLSNVKYRSLSGTAVPRDFVELPSQIMENWCPEPEMLKLFAKHYKTGEVIPQALVDKIIASGKFNQGFATVEYLAASILDMDYHTLTNTDNLDVEAFETASMKKIGLIDEIIPRYKSTYFNHIWGGGYSAGYYSYIWAEVLDADAFNYFKQSGDIFNPTIAKAYRDNILSKGGTIDAMTMYRNFRGQEPLIEPLLEKRGLKE
jgi:peptidyl-dipeptidase Dcp